MFADATWINMLELNSYLFKCNQVSYYFLGLLFMPNSSCPPLQSSSAPVELEL